MTEKRQERLIFLLFQRGGKSKAFPSAWNRRGLDFFSSKQNRILGRDSENMRYWLKQILLIRLEGVHWYTLVRGTENEIWTLHCIRHERIHDGGLLNSKRKRASPLRKTALAVQNAWFVWTSHWLICGPQWNHPHHPQNHWSESQHKAWNKRNHNQWRKVRLSSHKWKKEQKVERTKKNHYDLHCWDFLLYSFASQMSD